VSSLGKSFERQVFLPRHRSAPPPPPPTTRRTAAEHTSALSTRPLTPHATVRRRPRLLPPAPPPVPPRAAPLPPYPIMQLPNFLPQHYKEGKGNKCVWMDRLHTRWIWAWSRGDNGSVVQRSRQVRRRFLGFDPPQSCNFLLQSRWVGGRASGFCLCEFG
jgi:hypothetical protein